MDRRALIADVEASDFGPEVAAFFDFDGTVIDGYSGMALAGDRLRKREMSPAEVLRTAQTSIAFAANRATFTDLAVILAESLKGRTIEDVEELGERLFVQKLANRIYPEARDLIAAHRRRGHTIVMATSATLFQVKPLARDLAIDDVLSTRLETEDGMLTGRIAGPDMWGVGKQRAVEEFAAARGVDLSRSFAYADGTEDVALLGIVGNPRPTNPSDKLAKEAKERGWPVLAFAGRGRPGAGLIVRTVASYGVFFSTALVGAAFGRLNGHKQSGTNLYTSIAPELALGIAGVRVNVIGEHNLWSRRPAIFIFNHQSGLDLMIVMKLVRRDFAGAGKKELENNPIFRLVGSLIDIVYLDRGNTAAAVAELERLMKQVAADGKSIVISPEGTRSTTVRVGAFKKGAFRMAMAGGMPLVPIVIRNAADSQPGKSMVMRPAEVDVVVLPPVETDGWQLADLDRNMESVRQSFVDQLQDWPTDVAGGTNGSVRTEGGANDRIQADAAPDVTRAGGN